MGNTKGRKEAQNIDEMIDEALSNKSEIDSEVDLKNLINCHINQLTQFATKEKISLGNLTEVKKRSLIYLKVCEEYNVYPSLVGLAHALGYTDRALRYWRSKKQHTPTAQWLEMFNNMCIDIIHQSSLKRSNHPIVINIINDEVEKL